MGFSHKLRELWRVGLYPLRAEHSCIQSEEAVMQWQEYQDGCTKKVGSEGPILGLILKNEFMKL